MALAGRGRGRGVVLGGTKPAGDSTVTSSPGDTLHRLHSLLNSVAPDSTCGEIDAISDLVKKSITSKKIQEDCVEALMTNCKNNWQYSSCAAHISSELAQLEVEDSAFRSVLLTALKGKFDAKETLREQSSDEMLGGLAFLCQAYAKMRTDGKPYSVLRDPALDAINLLLDDKATEEELRCAATQLKVLGPLLQEKADYLKLNALKNVIRDKVVNNCGSRDVRLLLIKVLEGFASDWTVR